MTDTVERQIGFFDPGHDFAAFQQYWLAECDAIDAAMSNGRYPLSGATESAGTPEDAAVVAEQMELPLVDATDAVMLSIDAIYNDIRKREPSKRDMYDLFALTYWLSDNQTDTNLSFYEFGAKMHPDFAPLFSIEAQRQIASQMTEADIDVGQILERHLDYKTLEEHAVNHDS